jgi:hypothetical protein
MRHETAHEWGTQGWFVGGPPAGSQVGRRDSHGHFQITSTS